MIASVSNDDASLPALGSVKAKDPTIFPFAIPGKNFCFCSSVPKSNIACEHNPMVVEKRERYTADALVNSKVRRICSFILKFRPPYSSGIEIPKRPLSIIFCIISSETKPSFSNFSSFGINISSVNFLISSKYFLKLIKIILH